MIKKNFLFILNIAKIATSKNLLKMLGNNVNDKTSRFKLILVYDVITAHVSWRGFLSCGYQQEEKLSSILEVKMPLHFSDEQRHLIVYLHKKAISERKIASEVGCSKTGVNVTIKQWKETGKFEKRPGRGRKMKSTIRQDRALARL